MQPKKPQAGIQQKFRFPPELNEKLKEWYPTAGHTTLNAAVVFALNEYLEGRSAHRSPGKPYEQLLAITRGMARGDLEVDEKGLEVILSTLE